MAQVPLLLVLELQVQELAQAAALVQVREPVQVRVLELARVQVQMRKLVSTVESPELAQARVPEPPLARKPAQQSELAVILEQVRELRVSRQLELQQHRLPTAAQERLPYLPVLLMKAPCWGVPAW